MKLTSALRRVGSVLLGLAAVLLLIGLTDALVERLFPAEFVGPDGRASFPAWPLVAFMIAYLFLYAVVGGYLAARGAPDAPRAHALALAALLVLISLAFALANPYQQPMWYLLTCSALAGLGCWAGGGVPRQEVTA